MVKNTSILSLSTANIFNGEDNDDDDNDDQLYPSPVL